MIREVLYGTESKHMMEADVRKIERGQMGGAERRCRTERERATEEGAKPFLRMKNYYEFT